jgi:HK97 family phage major capsid protein
VELEGDAVNLVSELGRLLTDAQDQLLASALTVGSGTNQPQGIVTGLAAASGSKVSTTTGATLVAGDLYMLQNALPPRWQANAQWAASLALLNTARQFTTPNGSLRQRVTLVDTCGKRTIRTSRRQGSAGLKRT